MSSAEYSPVVAKDSGVGGKVFSVLVLLAFGLVEGFLMARGRIFIPHAIFDQMWFHSFIVMKMFLSALGSSMVVQAGYRRMRSQLFEASRFYKNNQMGYPRVLCGTFLVGVGMSLAGAGPTLMPVGMGVWVHNYFYIVLGCLAGGLVYGVVETFVKPLQPRDTCPAEQERKGKVVLEDVFPSLSYEVLAVGLGLVLLVVAAVLEIVFPFPQEVRMYSPTLDVGWPPMVAGVWIGVAQAPLRTFTGDGQGGSTVFCQVASTLTLGLIPGLKRFLMNSWANWWQFIYVWIGIAGGAVIEAVIWGELAPPYTGVNAGLDSFPLWRCLTGGFVMVFGARMAGGCTCGHGISGASELSLQSLAGTCAIFGGGIATALIIKCEMDWCR